MNKGKPTANQLALQSAIFNLKAQLAYKLQDVAYQTEERLRSASLVEDMARKIKELNRDNFAVKQHLKYVDLYSDIKNYDTLKL